MKRHECWRHDYRISRDLDHLSAEELSERLHDCINNNRVRDERARLSFRPVDEPVGETWMTLTTEVFEECQLRGYPYPGPISIKAHATSLDHAFDPIPDMDQAFDDLALTDRQCLFKFGDAHWLRIALDTGRMRIASASFYDSDSHNHARRDTELRRFFKPSPRRLGVKQGAGAEGWAVVASPTDYYLFSLAGAYSSRLFGDFPAKDPTATACLIIHKPQRLLQRIVSTLRERLQGWRIEVAPVTYYDPVRVDPKTIVVPTFKPFKHAYQTELRIICLPPVAIDCLAPFEIDVGPLTDCASLVDLSSHPPKSVPYDPAEDDPVRVFGSLAPEASMVNQLPEVASMQGIALNKAGPRDDDWFFQVQYTDSEGRWHELKMPVKDGLYLLNLLRAAEKDQATLAVMNREP